MNVTGDNAIFLRAFAAVNDGVAAKAVCQHLVQRVGRFGEVVRSDPPQQYWKIPEYWEVSVEFRPDKPVPLVFDDVVRDLGSGWEIRRFTDNGSWAVWNAGPESTFVIPEMRWANLECFQRSDAESEKSG